MASGHRRLARPASLEGPLDYEQVRDMVWAAIEHGSPRAGSLEAKIRPGAWVVIKPNIIALRPRRSYRTGDITDMRVTKAVLEYVAGNSRAARVTVAEGGSYRNLHDPATGNVMVQNGQRVNAVTFDWGDKEWPGFTGSLGGLLKEAGARFPDKKIDYVDLAYDVVRDASGKMKRIEVPRSPNGVGAFSDRSDYYVSNTVLNCDFLITVPVMKVHDYSGITCCLKNYVGTAPRVAYASPGGFSNTILHDEHEVDNRIDHFITDLAAFHPPDYAVVDGIRGLQYTEHSNGRPDQMVRSNLIIAGEDAIAADALAADLIGFNTWDMEFLQMAQQRQMGTMDFGNLDVRGDDPGKLRQRWIKPRRWYGRGNREWVLSRDPGAPVAGWERYTSPNDTLRFARWTGEEVAPGATFGAAVKVRAEGHRKAFLWVGARGKVTAMLNGETVMEQVNRTRYRVGQFQQPVELRPGENQLVFNIEALASETLLSAHLVTPRNDGDTVDGIRWG